MMDKLKHIVLLTGGNTGIGYETIKALYASSTAYTILMGSRSIEKAKAAIATLRSEVESSKSGVEAIQIDIEDDTSIDRAFADVERKYGRVDSLINNAGAYFDHVMTSTPPTAAEIRTAWSRTYAVNVTSTQVFTTRFMPLLLSSSSPRLLFLTSGLSSMTTCSAAASARGPGPNTAYLKQDVPGGWPKPKEDNLTAYRCSKAALNLMMLDWHRVLKNDGVKVFGVSPGFLATGLLGEGSERMTALGAGEARVGGEIVRGVVEGRMDANAGRIVKADGVQEW